MKNLAGDKEADKYIAEELYLAGVPMVNKNSDGEVPYTIEGKLGKWTFKRYWYYWVVKVEKADDGLPISLAQELFEKPYPVISDYPNLGEVVRTMGGAGCQSPEENGGTIPYPKYEGKVSSDKFEEIEKFFKDFKDNWKGGNFIDCYHIDDQIGLNEFVKFIKENTTNWMVEKPKYADFHRRSLNTYSIGEAEQMMDRDSARFKNAMQTWWSSLTVEQKEFQKTIDDSLRFYLNF